MFYCENFGADSSAFLDFQNAQHMLEIQVSTPKQPDLPWEFPRAMLEACSETPCCTFSVQPCLQDSIEMCTKGVRLDDRPHGTTTNEYLGIFLAIVRGPKMGGQIRRG